MSWKNCQIIMIPSLKKNTNIVSLLENTISFTTTPDIKGGTYYHLYITSDDEIKESDSCTDDDEIGNIAVAKFKKIIATTDSSLSKLPHPTSQFVEFFVNEYNKGNIIRNVYVDLDGKINQNNTVTIKTVFCTKYSAA